MTTYAPEPTPTPAPLSWPDPREAPSATDRPLLTDANIQGNVLAGFNKSHQLLLMLQLPSQAIGQAWLTDLIPHLATNADGAHRKCSVVLTEIAHPVAWLA